MDSPLKVIERSKKLVFSVKESYDFNSIEDPRITKIDDTFYFYYATYKFLRTFNNF